MTDHLKAIAAATTTPVTTPARAAAKTGSTSFAQLHTAAVRAAGTNDTDTDTASTKTGSSTHSAPKGEKTEQVKGHSYKEIVAGPRNGMFLNECGNPRDGKAFLIVKRDGREFHVYGKGDHRSIFEVGRERSATDGATGTTGGTTTGTTGTTG